MNETIPILDYGESTYERDFWLRHNRDYEDAAERIALRAMLPTKGGRLVEIGAGFGRLAGLYQGHQEVILLDYSPALLHDARTRLAPTPPRTVAANFYNIPLADGSCDTVVMVRVLHHAADVPAVLHELRRILPPGGTLILEHANKRHLKALLRHAARRGPSPFTLEPYEFARLCFDFHPAYIRQQLTEAGFQIEAQRSVSIFREPHLKRLLGPSFLAGLDGLLQRPLASLYLGPSVFLRCRAVGDSGMPPAERPLFRCPACHSADLQASEKSLDCPHCGASWPIEDGVYQLR